MRGNFLLSAIFVLSCFCRTAFSQTENIQLNAEKVKMFLPYVEARHGLTHEAFVEWKNVNKLQFTKEIWYYSESFSIKKNHLKNGVSLEFANIDISRYENFRRENEDYILVLPGFCDAIVLMASNKLIYKP